MSRESGPMPGRRHKVDSTGASYQKFAESLLIRIAAMTPVPQEQDFGNDYFCEPRVSLTSTTETVSSLCLIHVKGGSATLTYGGLDRKKEWMRYELDWLEAVS